jgi:signal transduction histidine kinase
VTDFARIVTLACHDLRTPLATVRGFAKTLQRTAPEEGPEARYLELIDAASSELAHLLDLLGLLARVESGRHELTPVAANTGEIARAAAAEQPDGAVEVAGEGEDASIDAELVEQALAAYARCALRHGGLERVELRVDGTRYALAPVDATVGAILLGDDLKDLGAAACTRILRALGGTVELAGGALVVAPPTGAGDPSTS